MLLSALGLLATGASSQAGIINVPGDYSTIQAAISAASNGDEIVVAPGTYNEVINFLNKAITVRSVDPSDPGTVAATIIDSNGVGTTTVLCTSGETPATVLDGVTVSGATLSGMVVENSSNPTVSNCVFSGNAGGDGGGMSIRVSSNPELTNCVFESNTAGNGGGVSIFNNSNPTLTSCRFLSNVAQRKGGGAYVSSASPQFVECQFEGNTTTLNVDASDGGGGLHNQSGNTIVDGCEFRDNVTVASSFGGAIMHYGGGTLSAEGCVLESNAASQGGGVYHQSAMVVHDCQFLDNTANVGGGLYNGTTLTLEDSSFVGNSADSGGGLWINVNITVRRCLFAENTAFDDGGGVYVNPNGVRLENCVMRDNTALDRGGGVLWSGTDSIWNCTISRNSAGTGGGIYVESTLTTYNSILWDNSATSGNEVFNASTATFRNCDIEDSGGSGINWDPEIGSDGGGNIDANPIFIDSDAGNLRLFGFPCVDAGSNSFVPGSVDIDGNERVVDGDLVGASIIDMGAYEAVPSELPLVQNVTQNTVHFGIQEAINAAQNGDELLSTELTFSVEPSFDFDGRAITLRSQGQIEQAVNGVYELANGGALYAAEESDLLLAGDLRVAADGVANVYADRLIGAETSSLMARLDSGLYVTTVQGADVHHATVHPGGLMSFSDDASFSGAVVLLSEGTLIADGELAIGGSLTALEADLSAGTITNGGESIVSGGSIIADLLTNMESATFTLDGLVFSDVMNDGQMTYIGNTIAVGDYTNNGSTVVQIGTLTIIGTLINNGVIIGDVVDGSPAPGESGTQPGDGLEVGGDYVAGPDASLIMPDPIWVLAVSGSYDMAINDNFHYHMAHAELQLTGSDSSLEVMSEDIGADSSGLDRTMPGHFPIGTLSIGSGATVHTMDAHDNDGLGQATCEAVYVKDLIVESGATLNTLGCPVYYTSLLLEGVVDDPANLIEIEPLDCPADLDGNGSVDVLDLIGLIEDWGCTDPPGPCEGDVYVDGIVDVLDLVEVITSWGLCP